MDRTDSRIYPISDFREWSDVGLLVLAPKFQRRAVWTPKARSYLIDTILRGLPTPKIFMRQIINDAGRTIREIVDGQQRLRAILSFYANGFPIMRVHGRGDWGGKYYEDLPENVANNFLSYNLSVDVLVGATDTEVLDIFARLNTYGVRLNRQELLNAKYFGRFKQAVYSLGYEFYRFWTDNGVLSESQVARMLEAELASELVIAMLAGIQSRAVMENYYRKYDDEFDEEDQYTRRFKATMDLIGVIVEDSLPSSNFGGVTLFYSLFVAIYDLSFGLMDSSAQRVTFDATAIQRTRNAISAVDNLFDADHDFLRDFELRFVQASTRRTTDLTARNIRHNYLLATINQALGRETS